MRRNNTGLWGYLKGLFIIFGIPMISYVVAIINPTIPGEDSEKLHLGAWFVVIPYWVALFYAHKYKQQHDQRTRQLGTLVDEHFTDAEKAGIRKDLQEGSLGYLHFLDENPKLAEEIELRKIEK